MKRTKITLEIDEITVIRRLGKIPEVECVICGAGSIMVTLEEAESLTQMTVQEICTLIGNNNLHFSEEKDGVLLICFNTLRKTMQDLSNTVDK